MVIDSGDSVIARLRAGDPTALSEAYERHAALCRGVAYRVLRDDALAEDAVQDAFAAHCRSCAPTRADGCAKNVTSPRRRPKTAATRRTS